VLPKMQAHFAGVAQVGYLVPLTLTVPMRDGLTLRD